MKSRKVQNSSLSPVAFDSTMTAGLGYAPRAMRLFKRGKNKMERSKNKNTAAPEKR